ncbi:hypothetical protein [Methylobacterium sp. D54C]
MAARTRSRTSRRWLARLERGRLKASVLDHLGEAPERVELQHREGPPLLPLPLLRPRVKFRETVETVGRAAADAWLHRQTGPGRHGFNLAAVFADPAAVEATLGDPERDPEVIGRLLARRPEAFGDLRGRRRVLFGDDRERQAARAALPEVARWATVLLNDWWGTYERTVRQEEERRVWAGVEIPGLSSAAEAFLVAHPGGGSRGGRGLITQALITQALGRAEGREVLAEFGRATPLDAAPDAFLEIPGMDRTRGAALGETLRAIRAVDVEQAVIADRLELAQRRGLERGGPSLEL